MIKLHLTLNLEYFGDFKKKASYIEQVVYKNVQKAVVSESFFANITSPARSLPDSLYLVP